MILCGNFWRLCIWEHLKYQYLKRLKMFNKRFYKYFVITQRGEVYSLFDEHMDGKMGTNLLQPLLFSYAKLINFYYTVLNDFSNIYFNH